MLLLNNQYLATIFDLEMMIKRRSGNLGSRSAIIGEQAHLRFEWLTYHLHRLVAGMRRHRRYHFQCHHRL